MPAEYKRAKILGPSSRYCPGCGHGIINRILADVLLELGVEEKTIGVIGVGCSCLMPSSFLIDFIQAPHGRAPATATGIKRNLPDRVVFTYQGDGDLASIGAAEIVHAAARNENISVIFVNNGVFGMTGGQMAPTTLVGQKTTTTPKGRDPKFAGMPMKVAEMLSVFPVAYIARGGLYNSREIRRTEKFVRNAIEAQLNGEGFSMVEILSPCPTNWHLTPVKARERLEKEVLPYYPVGELVQRREVCCK